MNYDELVRIAKNNPELYKLIQERSDAILTELAGPNVITAQGGHLSPDKRIAGALRDGIGKMGKQGDFGGGQYPVGRTGFLMQAKAGDMSSIGGTKLSPEVLKNAESAHSQFSRPAKRHINAYNDELKNVMNVLEQGDSSGMRPTAGLASKFGDKMGDTNVLNYNKQPNMLNGYNPIPKSRSFQDIKSGRLRMDLDAAVKMLPDAPEAVDESIRPYLNNVFSKAMKDLPTGKNISNNLAWKPVGVPKKWEVPVARPANAPQDVLTGIKYADGPKYLNNAQNAIATGAQKNLFLPANQGFFQKKLPQVQEIPNLQTFQNTSPISTQISWQPQAGWGMGGFRGAFGGF